MEIWPTCNSWCQQIHPDVPRHEAARAVYPPHSTTRMPSQALPCELHELAWQELSHACLCTAVWMEPGFSLADPQRLHVCMITETCTSLYGHALSETHGIPLSNPLITLIKTREKASLASLWLSRLGYKQHRFARSANGDSLSIHTARSLSLTSDLAFMGLICQQIHSQLRALNLRVAACYF